MVVKVLKFLRLLGFIGIVNGKWLMVDGEWKIENGELSSKYRVSSSMYLVPIYLNHPVPDTNNL
jgi:hypothetical protein